MTQRVKWVTLSEPIAISLNEGLLSDNPLYAVYRLWGENGRCLYVGQTARAHPILRIAEHKSRRWWCEVVKIDYVIVKDRVALNRAETEQIRDLNPQYNGRGRGRPSNRAARALSYVFTERDILVQRLYEQSTPIHEIAKAAGCSSVTVYNILSVIRYFEANSAEREAELAAFKARQAEFKGRRTERDSLILRLRTQNMTEHAIAKAAGCSQATAHRVIAKDREASVS